MVVRLRLQRFGRRNHAMYRLVAADSRSPRDGKCLEYLGSYNPHPHRKSGAKEVSLNNERIRYWLAVGAQPSDRVAWLLRKAEIMPPRPQMLRTRVKRQQGNFSTLAGAGAPGLGRPAAAGAPGAGLPWLSGSFLQHARSQGR